MTGMNFYKTLGKTMRNETLIPIPADFKVLINFTHPQPNLSPAIQHKIDAIWKKELIRTQGKIFNGKLLSADDFDGKHLTSHFVEYKHYLAQARDPALKDLLKIRPICVSGYTLANDHILMGKRADYVTDYQNFYELVPSGGIDPSAIHHEHVDVNKQLIIELQEEAGIPSSLIHSIKLTYIIPYAETGAYEICAKIVLDASALERNVERNEEYTELFWIPRNKIEAFVEQNREKIVPLSIQLIKLFS